MSYIDKISVGGTVYDIQDSNAATQTEVNELMSAIDSIQVFTPEIKSALLACFQKVAWVDEDGDDYYDALYHALMDTDWTIVNTLTHCTTTNNAQSIVKGGSYTATLAPTSGYTLTGATVTITMGGIDITSTAYNNGYISIASVTGNLVITASAVLANLTSISAAYTQSGTVYTTDTLDSLKNDLVVTAIYSDATSAVIPAADYTLSGTLASGTSTITVSYEELTTTFTVTVTEMVETLWINGYSDLNNQNSVPANSPFFLIDSKYTYDYTKKISSIELNVSTAGTLSIGSVPASDCVAGESDATAKANFVLADIITFTNTGKQKITFSTPISLQEGYCLAIGNTTDTAIFKYGPNSTDTFFNYCYQSTIAQSQAGLGLNVYVV